MTCWPVSTRVGNVKNYDPSLIEPITGAMILREWLTACSSRWRSPDAPQVATDLPIFEPLRA
jgi:hypothetical protein